MQKNPFTKASWTIRTVDGPKRSWCETITDSVGLVLLLKVTKVRRQYNYQTFQKSWIMIEALGATENYTQYRLSIHHSDPCPNEDT